MNWMVQQGQRRESIFELGPENLFSGMYKSRVQQAWVLAWAERGMQDIKAQMQQRLKEKGWDSFKNTLSCTIRYAHA
jgi:hypothetical protein